MTVQKNCWVNKLGRLEVKGVERISVVASSQRGSLLEKEGEKARLRRTNIRCKGVSAVVKQDDSGDWRQ